jgi:hypothetical protein
MSNNIIHLFSPGSFHEPQGIVGNREGLETLIHVIQRALEVDTTDATFFTSDGEGYDLFVKCISNTKLNVVALPYTEEYCKDERANVIYPWGPLL